VAAEVYQNNAVARLSQHVGPWTHGLLLAGIVVKNKYCAAFLDRFDRSVVLREIPQRQFSVAVGFTFELRNEFHVVIAG